MIDIKHSTILISGATGRIGSQLVFELDRKGVRPIAHVRKESDTGYIDSLGLEKRYADLRNESELQALVQGVDAIIHTAGMISWRGDRLTQFTGLNTFGATNLFRAAQQANVKRFVHVSTTGAVGGAPFSDGTKPEPLTEETVYNLDHLRIPYLMSKHAAEVELLARANGRTELVIVNPSITLSPRKEGNDINQGIEFLRWPLMPNFGNLINLVDLRDLAPGIIAALEKGRDKERYILGGDDITFRELVLTVSTLTHRTPHLIAPPRNWFRWYAQGKYLFDKAIGAGKIKVYPDLMRLLEYHWSVSSMKAHRELGYKFRSVHISLKDLLQGNFVGTYLRPNA